MTKNKLNISLVANENWFMFITLFPSLMIIEFGLFLHTFFTTLFILLTIFHLWISVSLILTKKDSSDRAPFKTFLRIFIYLIFVLAVLNYIVIATWASYNDAVDDEIYFDNWHLMGQFIYLLHIFFIYLFFYSCCFGEDK